MHTTSSCLTRLRRRLRLAAVSVPALIGFTLLAGSRAHAKPVPENLGNGLGKLVESNLAVSQATKGRTRLSGAVTLNGKTYSDERAAAIASMAISDVSTGRVLVRITLNGKVGIDTLRSTLPGALSSLTITAVDTKYRGVGIMNAYVSEADVPALAQTPGVGAVILELKPRHNGLVEAPIRRDPVKGNPSATVGEVLTKIGTAFDQGVTQHRVDQINQLYNPSATSDYEGQGMQIACVSNSYNSYTAKPASTDVTNGDLPGSSTDPAGNTTPVYILQDDTTAVGDDEGRAMCQIVHKMAPKAAIAFGTADFGEVGFANNIRGLAGIAGYTNAGQTFAADTICDDVGYFDEPFFQDGIIAQGVDDASAAGVCYFSSAANDIGTNGYDSDLRWVANGTGLTSTTNTALVGTNINLANVPAAYYAGGFHNFNPAAGQQDVAQTVNDPTSTSTPTELQWNEPYDQTVNPNNLTLVYTTSGTYASTDLTYTIPNALTAGVTYELDEIANNDGFDGTITILNPDGSILVRRTDNAIDESVRFIPPTTATGYQIVVGHYGTTTGAFTLNLYSTTGYTTYYPKTSIRLLVFDLEGNYLPNSSLFVDPIATDEPIQLGTTPAISGESQVQYVIARANVPTPGPTVATHVRYVIPGNGAGGLGPAEYFAYATATTAGHATSSTCNGCAAFSAFRPSLAETFSSPGPVTIYFDKMNNPLSTPDVRLQPRLAFTDNANVSTNMNFFASDGGSDPDTNPNFSGTSAAGPHGAAIAALVLQAKGGRHSVTPAQMTNLLERSTFQHDLDPDSATGVARSSGGTTGSGKVTISINSDNATTTGVGRNDTHAFSISYIGGSAVTSIVFNPGGTAATAGNVSGGNNGVTYSTSPTTAGGTVTYFENSLPGVAFFPSTQAFLQPATGTVTATAGFTNLSGSTNQYYTMTVTPTSTFSGGSTLYFTVGRGFARSATTGNTFGSVTSSTAGGLYYVADIFGGGVSIPSGTVNTNGMTFSGTTADGGTFSGVIRNNIGSGWSKTDGFGFVNAQAAVSQTVQ